MKQNKQTMVEYMKTEVTVSKWTVIRVALAGVFVGALLATVFAIGGTVM